MMKESSWMRRMVCPCKATVALYGDYVDKCPARNDLLCKMKHRLVFCNCTMSLRPLMWSYGTQVTSFRTTDTVECR